MRQRRVRNEEPADAALRSRTAEVAPAAISPRGPLTAAGLLGLQRSAGNRLAARAVSREGANPAPDHAVQRAAGAAFGPEQARQALLYNQRRGLTADVVRQVQAAVGAHPDGLLSEEVGHAVAQWQGAHALVPDGKLGPRTMAAIAEQAAAAPTPAPDAAGGPAPAGGAPGPAPTTTPSTAEAPASAPAPGIIETIGGALGRGLAALKEYAFGPEPTEQAGPEAGGPAGGPTQEPTANESGAVQQSELDTLMAKERLTSDEIRRARELIDAETDQARRGELFQALQSKVEYHSQRDNASTQNGKKIGDVMCNLTSLAMALTYLGVANPEPDKQFEDVLEEIRVEKKLPARTLSAGWGGVAAELGATVKFVAYNVTNGQDWYQANVAPALAAGEAVMASITGHIVRLQAVTPEGLVADDPFGNVKLTKGTGHGWDETNSSENPNAGEDSVWPWSEVSVHEMAWIARISR